MKLMMNVPWNIPSNEGKHKILYNNNENALLYDKYMVKIF